MRKLSYKRKLIETISVLLVVLLSTCLLTGCERRPQEEPSDEPTSAEEQLFENSEETSGQVFLGDTFTHEGIEVALGETCTPVTVTGDHAESYAGRSFLKIPVTVKNVSSKQNNFRFTNCYFYDCNGIETRYAGSTLNEAAQLSDGSTAADDITRIGNMRQGAQVDASMLLEYVGDGTYYIEFIDSFEIVIEVGENGTAEQGQ